jgi:hypothetical protein
VSDSYVGNGHAVPGGLDPDPVSRRIYAAAIKLEELEAVRARVAQANSYVAGLLAANGQFAVRVDTEMRTELQRVQGHLARVQLELKTLAERPASKTHTL